MTMLVVDHLSKTYQSGRGHRVEAVRDISFQVGEGEFVSIVGPSGGGKTTLLRCLCGLHERTAGSLRLHGRDIAGPPPEMAAVFQDYNRSLMPWMSVRSNVALPLRNKLSDKPARRDRVAWALAEVGLEGFADRYPWQLSGGMQQRAAIARAIAYQPQILVMDEPFASVDAQTRADLEDLMLSLRAEVGMGVLLVTHDIDEAVYLGDRVLVLSGRPATLLDVVGVDLPKRRDQISTKARPEFVTARGRVAELIRGAGRAPLPAASPE
jgi:NitT/TauT family transport system ATP-binding protein